MRVTDGHQQRQGCSTSLKPALSHEKGEQVKIQESQTGNQNDKDPESEKQKAIISSSCSRLKS